MTLALLTILVTVITLMVLGLLITVWAILRLLKRAKTERYYQQIHRDVGEVNEGLERIYEHLRSSTYTTEDLLPKKSPPPPKNLSSFEKQSPKIVISDSRLKALVSAYEDVASTARFIPISTIISSLVERNVVKSYEEGEKLITELALQYPKIVHIEEVRGSQERHVAIYL